MQITENIHGFMWKSMAANNCNTYLIDGPTRILIDPGHTHLFDHVQQGLMKLDLTLEDIGLIICTHAHPDHIEAVQRFKKMAAMTTFHHKEWHFLKTMAPNIRASFGFGSNTIQPDFFLKEGDISIDNVDLKIFHTPGHSPGSISPFSPRGAASPRNSVLLQPAPAQSVSTSPAPGAWIRWFRSWSPK